jgi:glycosyltransferase involved in cell wall biosynthesis
VPVPRCDPQFSIVIPTRNRPDSLASCLDAIARLDYPRHDFDVVVVDDGGDVDLSDACAAAAGCRVRVLRQPHLGPASARNLGAFQARGRYLAFTDDDCTPEPAWLRVLEAAFERDPDVALGGHTVNALGENIYSGASQMLVDYLYEYFESDTRGLRFFASNNLAVPAAGFRTIGGFDESFSLPAAEDREFCERWHRKGRRLVFTPEAVVQHAHLLGPAAFVRQHFTYGRGADHLLKARSRNEGGPVRVSAEPLPFYRDLVAYPLRKSTGWRKVPLALLMAISQVAYAAGYFWERLRHSRRHRRMLARSSSSSVRSTVRETSTKRYEAR